MGHAPEGVAVSPDGSTAFVSNQGDDTVSVLDLSGSVPTVTATISVGTHPNAEVLNAAGTRLYVADSESDQVSVIDTTTDAVVQTINLEPYPGARVGTNPLGLALSADGATLYVTNSGNNDVDVIDLATGKITGQIPTGWYPSAVVAGADKLYVANAKGLGAGPNDGPGYPDPVTGGTGGQNPAEYSGSMIQGTLSTVALPLDAQTLASDSSRVAADNGWGTSDSTLQPQFTDQRLIKHVIYIVRENRTYDQEFGSLGKGNGDPSLNLFGDDSATNSRALERKFVTLDNFYADAEVSAQGWNWDVSANSNPFAEALWPANYSGRHAPYPSESYDPAIASGQTQSQSYIWDHLNDAGISFRNYGMYVSQDPSGQWLAGDPVLNAHTDHSYDGWNLKCPDAPNTFQPLAGNCGDPRVTSWLKEFKGYVAGHDLPTVEFVRLPNDHTSGTAPGTPSPLEYVADNDYALGELVDAVSHSPYWKDTAIFVTEDDAQNGPDHVDAHRTTSMLISPYTQTGKVDSTFYSTVSMLRTIEDIVGIAPLTQFDTYATPMANSFSPRPDFAPYSAQRPADAGNTLQSAGAAMARWSARQNWATADAPNRDKLDLVIWKSIKGRRSKMPAPQHHLAAYYRRG